MAKICVFCGKRPEGKTREHIVPRWLIELTGDPKRIVPLSLKKFGDFGKREFAFDQFTSPACESCNFQFSALEQSAKEVVCKLLTLAPLGAADFSLLLDWLDKVRTGVWLAQYLLDKNFAGITPNFYVAGRIGLHDRLVIVYRTDCQRKGLGWMCTETPFFHYIPSCFSLMINNLYILNCSHTFLFSRRLGLPYPCETRFRPDTPREECRTLPGMERVLSPLLKKPFRFSGTEIYQPMYPQGVDSPEMRDLYETEYVRSFSEDLVKGHGKVLIQRGRAVVPCTNAPSVAWHPKLYSRHELHWGVPLMTLQLQDYIADLSPTTDELNKEQKRHWRSMLSLFKSFSRDVQKHCEAELRSAKNSYE